MATIYQFTMAGERHRLVISESDFAFERLTGSDAAGNERWVSSCSVRKCLRALLETHAIVPRDPAAPAVIESEPGLPPELMASLREHRDRLASDAGVRPGQVASDACLRDMAFRRPRNRSELSKVHGFGMTKVMRYGDGFLEITSSWP